MVVRADHLSGFRQFPGRLEGAVGLHLQERPAQGITLGQDGLGYLQAIVVSGYPTITVEFTNGNYSQFSSWLSTHTSVSVSLFGFIPLGSSSVDTYTASASQSSSGSSLTLTPARRPRRGRPGRSSRSRARPCRFSPDRCSGSGGPRHSGGASQAREARAQRGGSDLRPAGVRRAPRAGGVVSRRHA